MRCYLSSRQNVSENNRDGMEWHGRWDRTVDGLAQPLRFYHISIALDMQWLRGVAEFAGRLVVLSLARSLLPPSLKQIISNLYYRHRYYF